MVLVAFLAATLRPCHQPRSHRLFARPAPARAYLTDPSPLAVRYSIAMFFALFIARSRRPCRRASSRAYSTLVCSKPARRSSKFLPAAARSRTNTARKTAHYNSHNLNDIYSSTMVSTFVSFLPLCDFRFRYFDFAQYKFWTLSGRLFDYLVCSVKNRLWNRNPISFAVLRLIISLNLLAAPSEADDGYHR